MKYTFIFVILASVILLFGKQEPQKSEVNKMSTEKIKIEIWSDVVCPFCLLGKKKLEQAIAKYNAQDQVEITWRSFQLDPEFPKGTFAPSMQNLTERKGYPADQVVAMCGQLTAQGKQYGINFNFDSALTFNTFDAHRLIHWAKEFGKSNDLKGALMTAHFSNGTNLSDRSALVAEATKLGLDSTQAANVLKSDQYSSEVTADISRAQNLGIRGVPFFLINEKQSISGAQSDATFEQMILGALQGLAAKKENEDAGICLPNGECK